MRMSQKQMLPLDVGCVLKCLEENVLKPFRKRNDKVYSGLQNCLDTMKLEGQQTVKIESLLTNSRSNSNNIIITTLNNV